MTRRKAFTALELLLVIGVIVVLAGMVIWGLAATSTATTKNATRVTLQNLASMLEELNRKNKLAGFEGPAAMNPIYVVDMTTNPPTGGVPAPTLVTEGSDNMDRKGPAVTATAEVIRRLMALPDNRKAIEKLPSNQVMQVNLPVPTASAETGTVVLDGWHNPIIFVPSAGLKNVGAKQSSTYASGTYQRGARVINGGEYWTALVNTSSPPSAPDWFQGIRSPDGRAFWASAGPDGAFGALPNGNGAGDDNIYSFEQ